MNLRAVILSTAVIFGFIVVVLRLGDLMLVSHESLSARARNQHEGQKDFEPKRGGIYDRRGAALAINIDAESLYVKPAEIESPKEAAAELTKLTRSPYRTTLRKVSAKKNFVWVERKMGLAKAESIKELNLKGLGFISESKRYYPRGTLAAHVVGFVGVDNQPLEGIELKYDRTMRGKGGKVSVAVDASGQALSDGVEFETGGNSIKLTIDEGLQYIVEAALDEAIEKWNAKSVSAVMMNPFTGEILALANRPTYDLNHPGSYRTAFRRNRALTDTYEPGSTFKIITASAALEEGAVMPETEFDISAGSINVAGMVIRDAHRIDEVVSFREIIQRSSNVGTVMAAQELGGDNFYEYAKRFGFGSRTGIDLPGEASGLLRPKKRWSNTSLAALSIGYEVAVTPIQLLMAYSVIANGGNLVKPYVVSDVVSPTGVVLYKHVPSRKRRVISEATAETLREILVSVTNVGGTARGASVDGNRVAGKTGTTRLIDPETGDYSTEKYVSSFVGFVPADLPRIALVVVVREPEEKYYGGTVAAPYFRSIADKALAYLNIPREDTFSDNMLLVRTGRY